MTRTWIAGAAAAALIVAGVASAQTMGNGSASSNANGTGGNTGANTGNTSAGATAAPGTGNLANSPNPPSATTRSADTAAGTGSAVNGGGGSSNGAVNTSRQNQAQPARGANSFTQGEARGRFENHGYSNVSNLHLDPNGVWRGQATKDGQNVSVWLDYKGNVGQGNAQQANQ